MATRQQISDAYRIKSAESLAVAQACLNNGQIRAACNRAWYAIMQSVTACIYKRTLEVPPPRSGTQRVNWPHERCCENFRRVIKTCAGRRADSIKRSLLPFFGSILDYRNVSDYRVPPDHSEITIAQARTAVDVAGKIVALVNNWL
ncbi:MAG: HEPN domain-containing protein [Candidatus Obscuribacter sp.]|jgi:hypothetical protein|nr:HEPN domain-containing protein [Candidatus Obscuribacter sp.]MBK9772677.1 HEPN domain-containing protein [Candidatus Obscuribacter sp.]MDQ5964678.1 hypothetical protein [Cyanobacteriota bacterium erpe_2018_sw_39hr_WHONDRS-SW48-000098_B_bin.30]